MAINQQNPLARLDAEADRKPAPRPLPSPMEMAVQLVERGWDYSPEGFPCSQEEADALAYVLLHGLAKGGNSAFAWAANRLVSGRRLRDFEGIVESFYRRVFLAPVQPMWARSHEGSPARFFPNDIPF